MTPDVQQQTDSLLSQHRTVRFDDLDLARFRMQALHFKLSWFFVVYISGAGHFHDGICIVFEAPDLKPVGRIVYVIKSQARDP